MKKTNLVFHTFILLGILTTSCSNNTSVSSSSLMNNLSNLNGEWTWQDKKQDETYWLFICTNDGKSGTYQMYRKNDDWANEGGQSSNLEESGPFQIEEGYDRFGDKAYVAINQQTGKRAFLLTELENKYAIDWMLRIATIEDDMFAEKMEKVSSDCSIRNR